MDRTLQQIFPDLSGNLGDLAAPDAGCADLFTADSAVFDHFDRLDVGFEDAGSHFHHVHTDTTFFLGKTAPDNTGAVGFLFTADFAYIAHEVTSYVEFCLRFHNNSDNKYSSKKRKCKCREKIFPKKKRFLLAKTPF